MTVVRLTTEPGKYPLIDLIQAAVADHLSQETADLYVGCEWAVTGNGVADEEQDCRELAYRSELFNRMLIHAFLKLHGDELMQESIALMAEYL